MKIKRFIKASALFLLVFVLLISAIGCSNANDQSPDKSNDEKGKTDEEYALEKWNKAFKEQNTALGSLVMEKHTAQSLTSSTATVLNESVTKDKSIIASFVELFSDKDVEMKSNKFTVESIEDMNVDQHVGEEVISVTLKDGKDHEILSIRVYSCGDIWIADRRAERAVSYPCATHIDGIYEEVYAIYQNVATK